MTDRELLLWVKGWLDSRSAGGLDQNEVHNIRDKIQAHLNAPPRKVYR